MMMMRDYVLDTVGLARPHPHPHCSTLLHTAAPHCCPSTPVTFPTERPKSPNYPKPHVYFPFPSLLSRGRTKRALRTTPQAHVLKRRRYVMWSRRQRTTTHRRQGGESAYDERDRPRPRGALDDNEVADDDDDDDDDEAKKKKKMMMMMMRDANHKKTEPPRIVLTVQPVHLLAVAVILVVLFLFTGNQGGGIQQHNHLAKHASKHPTTGSSSSKSGHGGSSHRGNTARDNKGTAVTSARLNTATPTVDGARGEASGTAPRKFGLGRLSMFKGWGLGGNVPSAASSSSKPTTKLSSASATPSATTSISIKVEEAEEEAGGRGGGGKASMKRMKPIDFTAALGLADPAAGDALDMSGSSVGAGAAAAGGKHHGKHHKGDALVTTNPVVVSRDDLDMLHPKPECTPVNCAGKWSGWSKCDTHCGTGSERRRYTVTHLAACGGQACRYEHGEEQERPCVGPGANCCPGDWGRWTPCSVTCGGGIQARVYEVNFNKAPAGCEAPTMQEQKCNVEPCPQDCVGAWSGWSACDAVCGQGRKMRRFVVRQPALRGGVECLTHSDAEEEQPCEGKPVTSPLCKGLSCEGHYGEWGECSKPCMGGVRNRTFVVTRPAVTGGG